MSKDNYGNSTKNFIMSAIYEGIIGIENFKQVSSTSENQFMLTIGNHPFQYNNDVVVGKLYSYAYQRHRLVLLVNLILEKIANSYRIINEDIYSIMYKLVILFTIVVILFEKKRRLLHVNIYLTIIKDLI